MNNEQLQPIEARLQRLPLRPPPASLDARIAQLAAEAVRRRRTTRWLVAASVVGTVAAVLLAWVLGVFSRGPVNGPLPPDVDLAGSAIRIEQIFSTVSPTEVVSVEGVPLMQRVERRSVRHVRWIDEARNINIEWHIPSQQSVLVPLEYN